MNVTIIYGTQRKGCSYHITQELLKNMDHPNITEFFLPRDLPKYCTSCFQCFSEAADICPHSEYTLPIREKLISADLIILTSPVYALHVSGQMKVFLDHFANMFVVHRPEESMYHKQGLVIATAVGPVYKDTLNEMKDNLDFWGVAKTYKIGTSLYNFEWDDVASKIKTKVCNKAKTTAKQIELNHLKAKPSFRVKKWFYISRYMQKHIGGHQPDVDYWEEKNWLKRNRPWK
jgi:multimeric flavodoxin WrbA